VAACGTRRAHRRYTSAALGVTLEAWVRLCDLPPDAPGLKAAGFDLFLAKPFPAP
jgi:hypothetical protein